MKKKCHPKSLIEIGNPIFNMKKLILLLFIPLVFTCSSDNDSTCLTCTNVDFYTTPWGSNGDTVHCNEDLIVCEGDTFSSLCFVGANITIGDGTWPRILGN